MAALAKDRGTKERSGDLREPGVKAATTIYTGAMVALDASGRAVPMSTALNLKGIGCAVEHVDNSGGADNARRVRVRTGIFQYANSAAGDEITAADIGADCYGVDDQTVAKTSGTNTRSVAGKIFDVDAQGVWVRFS